MLHAAYRRVIDRDRTRHAALPAARVRDFVRALLLELLPLDEQREAELRVGLAFTARSVVSAPSPPSTRRATGPCWRRSRPGCDSPSPRARRRPASPRREAVTPPRWPTGSPGTSSARPERSHGRGHGRPRRAPRPARGRGFRALKRQLRPGMPRARRRKRLRPPAGARRFRRCGLIRISPPSAGLEIRKHVGEL